MQNTQHPNDHVTKGILFINVAFFLFSTVGAIAKWTSESYPILQIVFLRNFFALLPVMGIVYLNGGYLGLRTKSLKRHFARTFCGLMAMIFSFASYKYLPLPESFTLGFTAPFVITILSVLLLKETVQPYRWHAVAVGFLGVLIMAGPNGYFTNYGTAFALVSVVFYAFAMIQIRELSKTEPPVTIMFYFTVFSTLVTAMSLPFCWTAINGHDLLLFMALGFLGGLGQYFLSKAYACAPPSALAHYQYVVMVWGMGYGWVLWGDMMSITSCFGAVIIVLSGLYSSYREHLKSVSAA